MSPSNACPTASFSTLFLRRRRRRLISRPISLRGHRRRPIARPILRQWASPATYCLTYFWPISAARANTFCLAICGLRSFLLRFGGSAAWAAASQPKAHALFRRAGPCHHGHDKTPRLALAAMAAALHNVVTRRPNRIDTSRLIALVAIVFQAGRSHQFSPKSET